MNALRPPIFLAVLLVLLITACAQPVSPGDVGLPNPAAVVCREKGYSYEIRTDEDGDQFGVCIFADGQECDAWAFYRHECVPSASEGDASQGEEASGEIKSQAINPVALSQLQNTERLDILAPRAFSADVEEAKAPSDRYILLVSLSDRAQIIGLVSALNKPIHLAPRARCASYYILDFYLPDGEVESFGYGCGPDQLDFLRGEQDYWAQQDAATPAEFNELMRAVLADAPPIDAEETSVGIELPPRDDLPKVGKKWKPYMNDVFGYSIMTPPKAKITGYPVKIVPGDEIPEGLSADQYYTRLRKKYGKKLCTKIESGLGYIAISAPENTGEKYTVCGRDDASVAGITEQVELVQIGDVFYQARGLAPSDKSARLDKGGEVFWIEFEDGTVIEFGSRPHANESYGAYLKQAKPLLLTMLSTFEQF